MTWREYAERHALDGRLTRAIATFAPRRPRVATHVADPPLAPSGGALVSVIVPCYNYARYLPAAVSSALDQVGVDVEVVIVDDCSTDDSREVAAALARSDDRVRVVLNESNSGHVRSFNAGWAVARGDYAVKLDADDLLGAGALARAVALFEAYPAVGMVYGHPRHFDTPQPPATRVRSVSWDVWAGRAWLAERCRLGVSAITNPEMVMRGSLLRELGPMDPSVPYAPDMEISLRLAAVSDIGYVRGADQALHREHAASMSETDGSGVLVDLEARSEAFRVAFDRTRGRVPDAEGLEDLAHRALAEDALRFASSIQDAGGGIERIRPLAAFAAETLPASATWSSYRRVTAPARGGAARAAAASRRLRRRLRDEAYHLRWVVFGV
jgi:GT2 family glycosyltransferase